jgi:hypothetical protein
MLRMVQVLAQGKSGVAVPRSASTRQEEGGEVRIRTRIGFGSSPASQAVTRYVIHREDCRWLAGLNCYCEERMGHEHSCDCNPPSPEELAELVRISEAVRRELELAGLKGMEASLDAALIPFTKENQ